MSVHRKSHQHGQKKCERNFPGAPNEERERESQERKRQKQISTCNKLSHYHSFERLNSYTHNSTNICGTYHTQVPFEHYSHLSRWNWFIFIVVVDDDCCICLNIQMKFTSAVSWETFWKFSRIHVAEAINTWTRASQTHTERSCTRTQTKPTPFIVRCAVCGVRVRCFSSFRMNRPIAGNNTRQSSQHDF